MYVNRYIFMLLKRPTRSPHKQTFTHSSRYVSISRLKHNNTNDHHSTHLVTFHYMLNMAFLSAISSKLQVNQGVKYPNVFIIGAGLSIAAVPRQR